MVGMTRIIVLLVAVLFVFGCAGRDPGFETPTVGVSSFRVLPSEGGMPQFEIGLHIVNPNRSALKLEGIVYSVVLNGHKVLTGVSSDLPVIGAYSDGAVTLRATANLLSGISFLGSLMKQTQDKFTYELDANLDIGGLRPRIHVQEKGIISLTGAGSK